MKNILLILLLFTASGLSSCSTAQYPQSGTNDDVYYSSKDKATEQEKASVVKQQQAIVNEQEVLSAQRNTKRAYSNNTPERVTDNRRKQPAEEALRPFARALVEIALWSVLWHHSWNWPNIFIQF